MVLARPQTLADEDLVTLEVYEPQVGRAPAQTFTVRALQPRAREHHAPPIGPRPGELFGHAVKPGPAVGVGKRLAPTHLGDVGFGVEVVALEEVGVERAGKRPTDRGLAGARHPHHDSDDHDSGY